MSDSDIKFRNRTENNVLKKVLISFFIGVISFVFLLAVSSLILLKVNIRSEFMYIIVLISSSISSLISAAAACLFASGKRLITGMVIALILTITEFLLILCFNNANLSDNIYLMLPSAITAGFVGCVLGSNIRKK